MKYVAHPEWLEESAKGMRDSATVHLQVGLPAPVVALCLGAPAHRMLRTIYGGNWSVAWYCLRKAVTASLMRLVPPWLFNWWHRKELAEAEADIAQARADGYLLDDEEEF